MEKVSENLDYQSLILEVIAHIPSHRESGKTIKEVASTVAAKARISLDNSLNITATVITFFELFGVLDWNKDKTLSINGQISNYFIQSINWYLKNHQHILSNWDRSGVARDIKINNLLESAPYFLKILEERKQQLSKVNNVTLEISRQQFASILLIKMEYKGKPYFLHQWDTEAAQYQMIGGKQRSNEDHFETAKRELHEEITEHDLVFKKDYKLTLLNINNEPIKIQNVSRTYGALTDYKFWLYGVKFNLDRIHLSEIDRWISLDDMRSGFTKTGKKITDTQFCRIFDSHIQGGFESIPSSINFINSKNYLKFIEIKPSLLGIFSIDLKGIFLQMRKNKQDVQ